MTEAFTGFDWVVVSLVGLLGVAGLLRGFTQEALSLAGWIGAIVVVRLFHQDLTMWLGPRVGGDAAGAIVGFLLLFFGTVLAARLIAGAAGGLAKRSVLGPMDRVLGLGFGAVKGVILASVLFLLAEFGTGMFDPGRQSPAWLIQSRSAPVLRLAADTMVGWVRDMQEEQSGGFALPEGMTLPPGVFPPGALPPGALPPGHPALPGSPDAGAPDESGYSPQDRRALDQLLEEGAKNGEQVEI